MKFYVKNLVKKYTLFIIVHREDIDSCGTF